MKKAAGIAAGVVIAVGVVATAGAWFTGTRLEGVLQEAISEGNQQLLQSGVGPDGKAQFSIELVSLDRHLFSSTAHYRVNVQMPHAKPAHLLFVDHIEHGPLPLSRVTRLRLAPVMAASNFELEKSPDTEKWFAMNNGQTPLTGHSAIHYNRGTETHVDLAPLESKEPGKTLKFSGLAVSINTTADAQKYELKGNMANLSLDLASEEGPVHADVDGVTLDSGGEKGKSGFYLGHTELKVATLNLQGANAPAFAVKDLDFNGLMQEVEDKLAAQISYAAGSLDVGGQALGSAQMNWKFDNFDIASSKSLYALYVSKIAPQQQAAAAAHVPLNLQLSDADQQQLNTDMLTLLAAKPHIEMENLSVKTANGQSQASLVLDLTSPGTLDNDSADVGKKMISLLDAKVTLSKPMIMDLATAQAHLQGRTDKDAVALQAKNVSDSIGGMAVATQLGKVDGDNVTSRLHYADGMVDFNGQKMTVEQFSAYVGNLLGQQQAQR
ncbi:YdgA family protein [Pseudomonas sp.]|uniref:YdgA family protein n=1 Tax=Pseudomonas sp. TaxID=306 RepID=UPI003CC623ED